MRRVTSTSHHQRPFALIFVGLALVVGLAMTGGEPALAGEEVTVDGVLHVRNAE